MYGICFSRFFYYFFRSASTNFKHGFYQLSFLVVLCDISILVETKDLREGINGKGPDVINVTLVGTFFWGIVQTTGGEPENEDPNQHYPVLKNMNTRIARSTDRLISVNKCLDSAYMN